MTEQELTMSQRLELERMRRESKSLSKAEAVDLAMQIVTLTMRKENFVKELLKDGSRLHRSAE